MCRQSSFIFHQVAQCNRIPVFGTLCQQIALFDSLAVRMNKFATEKQSSNTSMF